ncbi:DNA ligase D [Rhodopila sp.]|uniref:DNA ligase D n=1 Tax=Rhodopila sp. TaxID=2480087 RepID=UPI003D10716C
MVRPAASQRDTSITTYQAKRDFHATDEPSAGRTASAEVGSAKRSAPIFVVQKHLAHRAGLHWDFRLEHGDVLWSWAVRKGPSLDPKDKRLAAHVEDHPLDYAEFQGTIADGQYGAGTVETWDRGTWTPVTDPDAGFRNGEIKFRLSGKRLNGAFVLIRLRAKPGQRGRQDSWLLIKEHDPFEQTGGDAETLEATVEAPKPPKRRQPVAAGNAPAPGAVRRALPDRQAPQLAAVVDAPPEDAGWLTEIKFDGYRILASVREGKVTLITRNGNDWTDRLPAVAAAVRRLDVSSAMLDGELVALDNDGSSSFPALQAALADGRDETLLFYAFDLLHLDGWDLRPCALRDRKLVLKRLNAWQGMLRFSDDHEGDVVRMRQAACRMKLEGIICKQADAPYRPGRGHTWLKVKCQGREEFVVIGWTAPAGGRVGLGSLQLGYYDEYGGLHYAGGVGTGFSDEVLERLRNALDDLETAPPKGLLLAGDDLERTIHWVEPKLVVETSFIAWSGAGRVRHAVFLGLREDKSAAEVVRAVADPAAEQRAVNPKPPAGSAVRKRLVITVPPKRAASHGAPTPPPTPHAPARSSVIVTAKAPRARTETIEGVTLTHPDRPLWPGISKRDLVSYWQAVAPHALPGLAQRPLAILRCPEGVEGEHFFQKHGHGAMPLGIRDGVADKAPFLAIDGLQGLVAMAQMSAVELHVWGAIEADALHADQLVFDLDPGEGVTVPAIVAAALEVREKLEAIGLASYCRTSGGKGLHVVVPLVAEQPWDTVRGFCKSLAEAVSEAAPDKYLAHVKIADRRGRILIDWLRNGLGSTAVASFCPRARPGAGVATPLAWQEVTPKLDLAAFTLRSVPERLGRLKADPWDGFEAARRKLPAAPERKMAEKAAGRPSGKATIVTAKPPKPRRKRSQE